LVTADEGLAWTTGLLTFLLLLLVVVDDIIARMDGKMDDVGMSGALVVPGGLLVGRKGRSKDPVVLLP
jgi:hypothetical protein